MYLSNYLISLGGLRREIMGVSHLSILIELTRNKRVAIARQVKSKAMERLVLAEVFSCSDMLMLITIDSGITEPSLDGICGKIYLIVRVYRMSEGAASIW